MIMYVDTGKQRSIKRLDDQGRCCGVKPTVYKRKGICYCGRCKAEYSLATGRQISNYRWRVDGDRVTPRTFAPGE